MNGTDHLRFGLFVGIIVALGLQFYYETEWVFGFILIVAGATFPDWDIALFGIKHHRNPLTHACWLSLYLFFFAADAYAAACFSIGIGTHLFLDLFPSDLSIKKGWQNLKRGTAPGDLRWIPTNLEILWCIVHSTVCIALGIIKLGNITP